MSSVSRLFHEGGFTMFAILALVPVALTFAGLHAGLARTWTLWTALGVIVVVLGAGAWGTLDGRRRTDEVITVLAELRDSESGTGRSDADEMRAEGYREASRPIAFAAVVGGIAFVPFLIGTIRWRRRRR